MKVLVIYVNEFSYQPAQKNLEIVDEITEGFRFTDSILAFVQVEEKDELKGVSSREKN